MMMTSPNLPFRVMIVEDDAQSRALAKVVMDRYFGNIITWLPEPARVATAVPSILENKPDILLLDLNLGDGTGFEVLDLLGDEREGIHVVMITASAHHIRRALRYDVVDFIDKPAIASELVIAIERCLKRLGYNTLELRPTLNSTPETPNLIVHVDRGRAIETRDVYYCRATNNYTEFFMQNGGRSVSPKTMKYYEESLKHIGFVRSSRSLLVNTLHCQFREGTQSDLLLVHLPDGSTEPVDPHCLPKVQEFLQLEFKQQKHEGESLE
jgi:two-component system LytT family response regulator